MDKEVSREVGRLKNGIPGHYRTRGYRLRLAALSLVLLLVAVGAVGVLLVRESAWQGRTYIFGYSESFYANNLYAMSDVEELLDERDMSRSEFEDSARVTFLVKKTLTDERISQLGLENISPTADEIKALGAARFYFILLDGQGDCLYQGTSIGAFIKALRDSGF